MIDYPEMMNPAQAAGFLGMSRDKVYQYLRKGILPGKKIGHEWIMSKTALIAMTHETKGSKTEVK